MDDFNGLPPTAPLIGIVRHRLATDGQGVTTLVAFHGCTLRCRYCLNAQCLDPAKVWRTVTPQELLDEVAIDNLYFLATGGGVTFGGGEPLLRSAFIAEFARLMPRQWRITMETALNVERSHLEQVVDCVNDYIIDIKDTHPDVYRAYTTREVALALDNLRWLLDRGADMAHRIVVRLPLIPEHNTPDHVAASRNRLQAMGVTQFDEFTYSIR
ncbi:MAG: radical SAM protein [Muribaculaceae bacterium]|nr:radical SAM protein [Muribaculaceae bacterium]